MVHTNEMPEITIEEVTDPQEIAKAPAQCERHRRNVDWLESHWDSVLQQARGRFVAVANQQAFIAETSDQGWDGFTHIIPMTTVDSCITSLCGKAGVSMRIVGEWRRFDDGVRVNIRGEFAVFTDPKASDLNILGRDVMDNFDVIVSRPRNQVLLLSQRHTYQVVQV